MKPKNTLCLWYDKDALDAAKFYAKYGVKAEDFVGTANSFTINTKMKQADAFVRNTGTDSTPTIVVGGRESAYLGRVGRVPEADGTAAHRPTCGQGDCPPRARRRSRRREPTSGPSRPRSPPVAPRRSRE